MRLHAGVFNIAAPDPLLKAPPQLLLLLERFRLSKGTSSTATPQLAPPNVRLSSSSARSRCGSAVGARHVKSWHTYAVALQQNLKLKTCITMGRQRAVNEATGH